MLTRRTRAHAKARDDFMINFLAWFCLACICMIGFEALVIADLTRIIGHH